MVGAHLSSEWSYGKDNFCTFSIEGRFLFTSVASLQKNIRLGSLYTADYIVRVPGIARGKSLGTNSTPL